jgi:hypothetical protein
MIRLLIVGADSKYPLAWLSITTEIHSFSAPPRVRKRERLSRRRNAFHHHPHLLFDGRGGSCRQSGHLKTPKAPWTTPPVEKPRLARRDGPHLLRAGHDLNPLRLTYSRHLVLMSTGLLLRRPPTPLGQLLSREADTRLPRARIMAPTPQFSDRMETGLE